MKQTLTVKRSDGTEVNLHSLTKKVLEKALNNPQDEVMLLAMESGTMAMGAVISKDPKLQAALLLGGQDLADWFLNFYLLGTMMAQTIERNGLDLEVVNEDVNEHSSKETSDRDSQTNSTSTD